MATVVQDFDAVSITNASVQFFDSAEQQPGTKFGCIGTIEGETEVIEIVKKEEGIEVKKKSKPVKMNLTVSAHIPVQVARDFFGLKTEGLKTGIWSYGSLSKGKRFVLTADVVDEFEDIVKLIAFSNCTNSTGFKISIENGADEVAQLELEFTALADELRNFYYEAFIDEIEDEAVKTQWHTQFNPTLVQSIPTP